MTEKWVKDARAGDQQSWSFLYGQYYPVLYSLALKTCNNIPDAKDAVQAAFVTAYLRLESLRDPSAFGAWLRKILIRNTYRTQQKCVADRMALKAVHESCDEMSHKLESLHTQSRLQSALAILPDYLQSTLLLRYFSGFHAYETIAEILSIPVGTVRSRLNQAKIKLAELWEDHSDTGLQVFKQNQEWNGFYYSTFAALHEHDSYKSRFLNHLQNDIRITFSRAKTSCGRWLIDREINEDRKFGSWFSPVNIFSSGNISVVEVKHFNSSKYPAHCPESSVFILYRNKGKVNQMTFHHSRQ
jgi:RNA polymerase sigma-70 factor (ECF subfamily)